MKPFDCERHHFLIELLRSCAQELRYAHLRLGEEHFAEMARFAEFASRLLIAAESNSALTH